MKKLTIDELNKLRQYYAPANLIPFEEAKLTRTSKKEWVWTDGEHVWTTSAYNILRAAQPCPYCGGRKAIQGFNDLATTHPEIAAEWDYQANDDKPQEYLSYSNTIKHWKCKHGHKWETSIANRATGKNCPYCAGNKPSTGKTDLETVRPELLQYWDYEKNNPLQPKDLTPYSHTKVHWKCPQGHTWIRTPKEMGTECPVCSNRLLLQGFNDLATTHPEIAAQWDYQANGNLTPKDVISSSHTKIHWICSEQHKWVRKVATQVHNNSCPICSGWTILSGYNDLATLSPELAAQWDYEANGNLKPQNTARNSGRKVSWLCQKGHKWESVVASRQNDNCPVCSNRLLLQGFNDLATTHPEIAAQWDYQANGNLTPQDVTYGSDLNVAWTCSKGHKWTTRIANRQRTACPQCAIESHTSKGEKELYKFIRDLLPDGEIIPNDRSLIAPQELDVFIPEKRVAIEFNGVYWHSEECGKDRHYHYNKWLECREKGVQLLQVWEDDWARNPELIKRMLAHKLGVDTSKRVYGRNTRVRMVSPLEARLFLNQNHVQGAVEGGVRLGLTDKTTGKLIALLVLKQTQKNSGEYSLLRYATSVTVVGGFTKLLTHVEKQYNPEKIITFSDHCVSDGGLYENNGFTAVKELKPDYMYVRNGVREHKFGYRLKRFRTDPELTYEEGLTERELAALNNLPRIWDAGKTKWVKE